MLLVLIMMMLAPQEKDAALGAMASADIRRQTKPIPNTMVREYIDRLGRKLSAAHFTFEPVLGDLHEPLPVPGRIIFVPGSVIVKAQSEYELALALARAIIRGPRVIPGKPVAPEVEQGAVRMVADAGYRPNGTNPEFQMVQQTVRDVMTPQPSLLRRH
jgi:hypothetical protein